MNSEAIPILITKTIAQEYLRRDVFPELRPDQQWFVKKFVNGHLYHTADYKLAYRVLDDALEQHDRNWGRRGAGITIAYRSLAHHTERYLRQIADFDPAEILYGHSLALSRTDFGGICLAPVEDVFRRFGIPLADAKRGMAQ